MFESHYGDFRVKHNASKEKRRSTSHCWPAVCVKWPSTTNRVSKWAVLFIQLKRTVRHGEWEAFYEAKFGKGHVTLGTAQRYMKLARRDAEAKNGVAPFLKPGGSRGGAIGQAIRDANEQAKADQGARRRKEKVFLDSMFRKLTAELLNLPSWPTASHEILDLFKHVRNKFGIVHEVTLASENADKEVHLETAAD